MPGPRENWSGLPGSNRCSHLGRVEPNHSAKPAGFVVSQKLDGFVKRLLRGAAGWNRTTDTGIFSPLLYQLSYRCEDTRAAQGAGLGTPKGLPGPNGGFGTGASRWD